MVEQDHIILGGSRGDSRGRGDSRSRVKKIFESSRRPPPSDRNQAKSQLLADIDIRRFIYQKDSVFFRSFDWIIINKCACYHTTSLSATSWNVLETVPLSSSRSTRASIEKVSTIESTCSNSLKNWSGHLFTKQSLLYVCSNSAWIEEFPQRANKLSPWKRRIPQKTSQNHSWCNFAPMKTHIIEGRLICSSCNREYPIVNGIPNMILNEG